MNNQNWTQLRNENNLHPLSGLRRGINRVWDDEWIFGPSLVRDRDEDHFKPLCDLREEKDHFLLSVEVPGVSKDEINIFWIDNHLVVSGERRTEKRKYEEGEWYSERHYGKFERTFNLPLGVIGEKIEAHHLDGVLQIYLPKVESAKPRQIKVGRGVNSSIANKVVNEQSVRSTENRHIQTDNGKDRIA